MKATATHKLIRLTAVLGSVAAIAAIDGGMHWSDETLKQEIEPIKSALELINQL